LQSNFCENYDNKGQTRVEIKNNAMIIKSIKNAGFFIMMTSILFGCKTEDLVTENAAVLYSISNGNILKNGAPIMLNGVNTLNTFGIANQELYASWNIKIIREFIGNLREQPITGLAIEDSQTSFLHPLQNIVDANRVKNVVTILCPFGWVDEDGNQTLFTGLNPSEQEFYNAYKIKMKAIAEQFKEQPDVWIEVWNEPYHFNNENGYSHQLWLNDQTDMINNLRSVAGFNNIILVPGNEQGQSETAIIEKGATILTNQTNILFDLHAYEKWLLNSSTSEVADRINLLKNLNFSIIFGEVGVINASGLMPVNHFLSATKRTDTSTLAWLFNRNTDDQNALLTDEGLENNTNNTNWGTTFRTFLGD
jgi:mannan endo-1,4-beta-mannosidase